MQDRQQIEQDIRTAEAAALRIRDVAATAANGAELLEAARAIERLAIIASRDETDQGFSNHETFGVAMFLAGNLTGEAEHRRTQELTREAIAMVEDAQQGVADALETWCSECVVAVRVSGTHDPRAALALELLTAALGRVDWRELAEVEISAVAEQ